MQHIAVSTARDVPTLPDLFTNFIHILLMDYHADLQATV